MATIDLGKIKQVWRGTYNNSTAYTVDDLVAYTDTGITSTYICVANSTGNAPSSSGTAHASWNYMAKGVADSIPSQSGNAGKVLKTDGSSTSWGAGSKILQVIENHSDTGITTSGSTLTDIISQAITPSATTSKILVLCHVSLTGNPNYNSYTTCKLFRGTTSGTQIDYSFQGINTQQWSNGSISHGNNDRAYMNVAMSDLDAPNTTSATTYTFAFENGSVGTTNSETGGNYSIILIEVAA